jgi:enoyl-[acyl-carrier protein] reductase II
MLMSSTADDALELAAAHRVPVVTTGAGFPGKVIERMKPLGSLVLPVIASVSHARRVAKQGADAVIAEGTEAGGHIGETTTMCLIPQVAEAVSLPVIAAGGIADSRGVLAAFALGAQGVQVGTRFLCAEECRIHENYKAAVLKAGDRSTAVTGRPTGHPVRCLKNKLSSAFDDLDKRKVPLEEYERLGEGKLRSAVMEGDADWGSLMAGQSAGMVNSIEPCAAIVESFFSGISERLEDLKKML